MTHPELVQALRTPHVFPQVGVPKTTERMVPSFVLSGERIHVLHLLTQCCGIAPLVTIMTMMTIMGYTGDSLMGTQSWTVAEAKAKFSEIIDRAVSEGPQTITRKGRTAAVVVGAEEWQRKTKRVGSLAEFFAASPLRGSGLKVRRRKERPRKINL